MEKQGEFRNCTENEKVRELRAFIERLNGLDTYIISDHIINLLNIEGRVKNDKNKMLGDIDFYLSLSEREQRRYQLARRGYYLSSLKYMSMLGQEEKAFIDRAVDKIGSAEEWEKLMRELTEKMI